MRQITYTMRFHRAPEKKTASRKKASAPAPDPFPATWMGPDKASLVDLRIIEDTADPTGARFAATMRDALFESYVLMAEMAPDGMSGSFLEQCRISGAQGSLSCKSTRLGTFTSIAGAASSQAGSVIWQITGGAGDLDGVTGTITSNFLLLLDGEELVDNHLGILFLPEPTGRSRARAAPRSR
jgi:hypothetical protein